MLSKYTLALAAGASSASATIYQGFNYGAGTDFATEFALAKSLVGTSGAFTSARLYTTIEQNTATNPSSAIPAAIQQDVSLLLGIWGSGGQATVDNEITALKNAIAQYGSEFTSRVVGISVGSEDLYRESPTGIEAMAGIGANPADIVNYISQVRSAIAGTGLSGVPVGHVDTWTAWVNGSNSAVVSASDFLGMDAYPYFQSTQANSVSAGPDLFFSAYQQTVSAGQGKPVWVTETGWPVSGPVSGQADASTEDAESYWQGVACKLLGETNTWWYTLNDAGASPSFGLTTGSSTPLYDLTCNATVSSSSSSSSAASSTATSSSVAAGSASASASATSTDKSSSSSSADHSTVLAIGSSGSASAKATTTGASASAALSSSAASLSAKESTATPSNLMVSVSSSAVASQIGGGSPGAKSSAAADSSVASVATASSSLYSSILASASSAAAASPTASPTSVAVAPAGTGASGSAATGTAAAVSASGTSVAPFKGAASAVGVSSVGAVVAAVFALVNLM